MHHLHLIVLPILVSGVILWILGAAWYSPPLFAKPWMAALGIKPDPGNKQGLAAGMIASLVGDIILALVLEHIIYWSHAFTVPRGLFIGFLMWLGFFAAPNFPQGIYERRPFKLFAINNGYWLVGLLIVSVLMAVWR